MSSHRKPKPADCVRIRHMPGPARRACELAQEKEVGLLGPDSETALALAWLLEILGDVAQGISLELEDRYPEAPWRDIADTRNGIVHMNISTFTTGLSKPSFARTCRLR